MRSGILFFEQGGGNEEGILFYRVTGGYHFSCRNNRSCRLSGCESALHVHLVAARGSEAILLLLCGDLLELGLATVRILPEP